MVDTLPRHNLSQQIPIVINNQDTDSNPADISNQDMANSLVGISSPAGINNQDMANSLVGISRDHMEHLPMGPRVL